MPVAVVAAAEIIIRQVITTHRAQAEQVAVVLAKKSGAHR
jgi:hypothetical protein